MSDCDIIINGAGNVTFNPPLESALQDERRRLE